MKKQKNRKGIVEFLRDAYYSAPQIWYRFLGIAAALLIWLVLCFGAFIWSENRMKEENIERCEEVHEVLTDVENQCKEQVKDIYKESELLGDFWLFWNHDMEGYMEQRLLVSGDDGSVKSFPEYMNVFLTEHKNIFNKIYFLTVNEIYSLQAAEGGGGVYNYDISRDQYREECRNGENGYPIFVSVQDIYDKKTNVGEIVFLVNDSYLFERLKTAYNEYVTMEYGGIRKFGEESAEAKYQDFGTYWTIYECSVHGNKIEIGFQISDILRKYWFVFLTVTVAVIFAVGLMFVWLERIAKSNTEFLGQFIQTIQLAKEGDFRQIEVGKRKDNYAMLAGEINDMIISLDLHIKKEYLLKISQQETEMRAMLYQINPHFLYNTLEIIRAQANIEGNSKAADALFDLGSMYRMLVKLGDTISMGQEVKLLTHYLNILELGHQDNFYYEIDVEEELLGLNTIKFWMQPLAENYLVHGYDREREFNLFFVQGRKTEKGYQILVMDNGSGMETKEIEALNEELGQLKGMPKEKLGIRNVCQRLRYFYRERMTFQVKANEPRGLCIEISIEEDWDRG